MQIKVTGESPFQILSSNFTIGPSESGYDLMFSADGLEYSKLFTVGANTNRQVTQVAAGSYYFLSGNTDTVTVNWMKDCGGGSGGGSYVLPVASENTLGGVKIGSGITVDSAGTISVEVQSGGAQEAKTIVLSTLSPEDFSEDDIDAMQEMVDYLAEFPVDALPAARIFAGGNYFNLDSVGYEPEDTENQTPEERYSYRFNYAEVYGDEGMDESQIGYINTFFLNAENVEESYNMYWDSSEQEVEKLSAVEDPNELDARVGDVAAKNKSVVNAIHIDWSNLPFSEDMDVLVVGNLTLHAWDNDGTDTLTVGNGGDSYDFVDDGDNALLQYTDNLYWSVLYESGDVRITLADSSSKVYFDENLIALNDCDAQYDGKVIPDGLYQYDEDEGEWKPIISAGSGISIEDGAISVNIGDGLAFSGNTIVVSGGTGGGGEDIYVINDIIAEQSSAATFYTLMKDAISGATAPGWDFKVFYRYKFFGMNDTLVPMQTAWINDYNSFGNENVSLVFRSCGYASVCGSIPDQITVEIADDGSASENSCSGQEMPGVTNMTIHITSAGTLPNYDELYIFGEQDGALTNKVVAKCGEDNDEWGMAPIKYVYREFVGDNLIYHLCVEVPNGGTLYRGTWHWNDQDREHYTTDSWAAV